MPVSFLAKQKFQHADWDSKDEVLDVRSIHTLSQAAGYLKHVHRKQGRVYFRGQTNIYPKMYPSLFRSQLSTRTNRRRFHALCSAINELAAKGAFLANTPDFARAPLLQHYGISTDWLDLVDNLWVALWFGAFDAKTLGRRSEYIHFADRVTDSQAYIVAVLFPTKSAEEKQPGLWRSDEYDLIDLRVSAPSLYVRPHAQHGLLVRPRDSGGNTDLSSLVVGVFRVQLAHALDWLGRGQLLSTRGLFPPPHFDYGYRGLLEGFSSSMAPAYLGSIQHVGI